MLTILQGDWIEQLKTLPDQSVQCCVTSPPYWGLRDYGTAKWEGGNSECDHKTGRFERGGLSSKQSSNNGSSGRGAKGVCPKCGAKRIDRQLGLEKTPQEYVEKLVAGFREVKRVLKDDGTLWLNLGDSYASAWACKRRSVIGNGSPCAEVERGRTGEGLKEKDLVGVPWMTAFALRANGWYLRSDIIWAKPNPMPESVTDRPTKSHEYIFLLSKKAKYFYDHEAIKEKATESDWCTRYDRAESSKKCYPTEKVNGIRADKQRGHGRRHAGFNERWDSMTHKEQGENGRNKRSVWTVPPANYPEAHFATFPPDLIKPCILAGSKSGDTILDPFFGSGTTGMVSLELGRKCVGIELNPAYIKLAERRCDVTYGLKL